MTLDDQAATPERIGRKAFLRKLGAFAAIGAGVALVPAQAHAVMRPQAPTICCPNQSACGTCSNGTAGLFCNGGSCGGCCICGNGTCISTNNCPC